MLTFTPVTQRDIARLRRYYKSCEYQLCEYSALVKLMWRGHLHPSWAKGAGCLIVRNFIDGQYCFDYPVPGPDGDEDAALALIAAEVVIDRAVLPKVQRRMPLKAAAGANRSH